MLVSGDDLDVLIPAVRKLAATNSAAR